MGCGALGAGFGSVSGSGGMGRGGLSRKSSCVSRLSALGGQESGGEETQAAQPPPPQLLQGARGSGGWAVFDRAPFFGSNSSSSGAMPAQPQATAALGGAAARTCSSDPASAQHSMRSSLSACDSLASNTGCLLAPSAGVHQPPHQCITHAHSPTRPGGRLTQGTTATPASTAAVADAWCTSSSRGDDSQASARDCALEQRILALAQVRVEAAWQETCASMQLCAAHTLWQSLAASACAAGGCEGMGPLVGMQASGVQGVLQGRAW